MTHPAVRTIPYLISYLIPLLTILGLTSGGPAVFLTPLLVFVLLPLLELVLGSSGRNTTEEEEERWKSHPSFSVLLWGHVLSQYAVLGFFLEFMRTNERSVVELAGATISTGIMFGGIGIVVAHELIHRRSRFEQFLGKALLWTTNYLHFFIEHIRGHHKLVGTPDDPASARLGESFWRFVVPCVVGSYVSSWRLEGKRLREEEKRVWGLQNQMVRFLILTIGFNAAVVWMIGGERYPFFLAATVIAFSLLEVVNYIEHYGLERPPRADGTYGKVEAHHSWNSNNFLSRWFLFELTRHSDHHMNASRKYQVLRQFESAPQHPTGYPGMILLALVPPLWFKVMDHRTRTALQNATPPPSPA